MKERIEELAREYDQGYDSMKEILTTAVNETLELAAKECEIVEKVKWNMALSGKPTALKCSEAIRKLKV